MSLISLFSYAAQILVVFIANRCTFILGYLIVGKDSSRQRMADAAEREVPILTLNMLNAVLNGLHSFDAVESLPTVTIESLEGTAYQTGGGALPDVISKTAASTKPAKDAKKSTKKKASAAKDDVQKPAAKKATKAKREKKAKPPSDPTSIARAAMAAAEASKNAHRAIEAAQSVAALPAAANCSSNALVVAASDASTALATGGGKARFVIPKPGVNGAISGVLDGKKFVLTGVFPEIGGGSGLNMGKDRMKEMIESFGGKVTGSVSGKTSK